MERFLKPFAEISLAGNIIMNLSCVCLNSSEKFQTTISDRLGRYRKASLRVRPEKHEAAQASSWFDKLAMRAKLLKIRDLILSFSKDEAKIACFFSSLLV